LSSLLSSIDRFLVSLIAKWNASSVPLYGGKRTWLLQWQVQQEAWTNPLLMLAQASPHSYS